MKSRNEVVTGIKFESDSAEKGNDLIVIERRDNSPKRKHNKKHKEISSASAAGSREYRNEIHPVCEADIAWIKCDPDGNVQATSRKKKRKKRKRGKSAALTEETFGIDRSESATSCPVDSESTNHPPVQSQSTSRLLVESESISHPPVQSQSTSHLPAEPQMTCQNQSSQEIQSEFLCKSEKDPKVKQIKQEIMENTEGCDMGRSPSIDDIDMKHSRLLCGKDQSYCVKRIKRKKRRMESEGPVSNRKVTCEHIRDGGVTCEHIRDGGVSGEGQRDGRVRGDQLNEDVSGEQLNEEFSGEQLSEGEVSGEQLSEGEVSGEQLREGEVNGEQTDQVRGDDEQPSDEDARVVNSQEPSGSDQSIVVKKTDLFVPADVDAIIHSTNRVMGNGRVEKLMRANLRDQGIHLRTGKWTAKENEKLKSNWEEIIRNHPISNPYKLFTGSSSRDKDEKMFLKRYIEDTSFYQALARGLNRTTYSCYIRARRMFHDLNRGSYSDEEFQKLKRFLQTHGNKWTEIGKLMGRTGSSLFDMHRDRVDRTHTGHWSSEEEIQLLDAIRKVMGSADVTNLYKEIPWQQIAGHMPTRSAPQCREHWWKKMAWKVNNEGYRYQWRSSDRKKLVEKIYIMPVVEESEIDWDGLHLMFDKSVSPQYLQKRWFYLKTLVPNFQRKSFDEIRDFLYNKYEDERSKDEDSS